MKKHRELIMFLVLAVIFIGIVVFNRINGADEGEGDKDGQKVTEEGNKEPVTEGKKEETLEDIFNKKYEKDVTVKSGNLEKVTYTRQAEYLDRGLVAVSTEEGVFLSWRFLGTDDENTAFNVYRDGKLITDKPVADKTNYVDKEGIQGSKYYVETVLTDDKGNITQTGADISKEVSPLEQNYFDIPLSKPASLTMPDKSTCTYTPNDASVGDLDGDGQYEIILKWEPSNAQDNSKDGYTGNVYIDAYKMDGTFLWRIDLGVNIRAGAHYTQFMVYDFDGDGRAELVCKTADGTVDGKGSVIGDGAADYRSAAGRILEGPEYLTLFDGLTGEALDTIDYEPARGNVRDWGDDYGNRVDRFLAAVAYLDGKKPSVIMCRGYYTRAVLAAYDVSDKKLVHRWTFDSNEKGNDKYAGQGNHNLAVADVDWDGYDEIVYGQCIINEDGTGLVSTGMGHGDAIHVGDFLPEREGLEVWGCLEASGGAMLWDGSTGECILRIIASGDTGRAVAGNFIPGNNGSEFVSSANDNVYDAHGNILTSWSSITKWSQNYAIYWDGDLEQEILDRNMIDKYKEGRLFNVPGVSYNNGTKANTSLTADILGDWREEMIFPTTDGSSLRVFTTTYETDYRIFTLMHDTQYRCQAAAQNVAYNQGAYTSFFLGTGYDLPGMPDIETVRAE